MLARTHLIKEERSFLVTEQGQRWLCDFGLDLEALRRTRRKFAPCCLDWSERKDHPAGALGATLAERVIELGWLARNEGSLALTITGEGKDGLLRCFDLALGNSIDETNQ